MLNAVYVSLLYAERQQLNRHFLLGSSLIIGERRNTNEFLLRE